MAVWPCRLKTIACFCKRDPIILGVDILDGNLRVGTPLCVVKSDPATGAKEIIELGKMYGYNLSRSQNCETDMASQHFSRNQSQIYRGMCHNGSFARAHSEEITTQLVKKTQAGGGVAVKIEHAVYQSAKMFGRHFDEKDEVYSRISRQSIDVLKVCPRLLHVFALL